MRIDKKERLENYYNCLIELKLEIDKGGLSSLKAIIAKNKVGKAIGRPLILHGVIWKDENVYNWNPKIPVSMDLAKKMVDEVDESLRFFNQERKRRIELASEIIKREQAKQKRKQAPKTITNKKPLVKVTKQVKSNQPITNKVGLIRRFIRWIY